MARVLDRSKPFGEVFGDDPNVKHRYFQFGMKFDEQGNLVGEELPVPPDEETEVDMRVRIEKEIRAKLETEYREKLAEAAKTGGGDGEKDSAKGDAKSKHDDKKDGDNELPGALGKHDHKADGKKK